MDLKNVMEPRINLDPKSEEDLQSLLAILGIEPVRIRLSCYRGLELVLGWVPDFHSITVIGLGAKYSKVYCYSKKEFPGSSYNNMGDWELSL